MVNVKNCTVEDFLEMIKDKKIVCFCAGKKFMELCEIFNIESKILYVVDNYKNGKNIKINDWNIPIITIDKIGEELKECVLLISSLQYSAEIIQQLDNIPMFNDLTFFLPELFIKNEEKYVFRNSGNIIPKVIHYCWFGKNEIPKQYRNNIESWKRNCPDYEIIRWDESNYDITKNKYMLEAYESKKWGFVPDYARLDIIYNYGGIYLDTDVEVLKSYDKLLSYKMFCGFESNKYIALGLGFGAIKNHKIIDAMKKHYDNISFFNKDGSLNLIASPVYQTQIMRKLGLVLNGKTQETDSFLALSTEYLAPINFYNFGQPTSNSFSIHQYSASWCQDKKNKVMKISEFIKNRMK